MPLIKNVNEEDWRYADHQSDFEEGGSVYKQQEWGKNRIMFALPRVLGESTSGFAMRVWVAPAAARSRVGSGHVGDAREEAGRIVTEPVRQELFDIDDLVAGITDENRHDPVETGPAAGREFW